jgi:hypothetical protein
MNHLEDAVNALSLELSGEEIENLSSAYQAHAVYGHA